MMNKQKNNIPYKYWYLEHSDDPMENLFYCHCMGLLKQNVFKSICKQSPDKIEKYLSDNVSQPNYKITKCYHVNDMVKNLIYHVGDVLLLDDNCSDADFSLMKDRILNIADKYLQGARENKPIIMQFLINNLKDIEYNEYDSVYVRDNAIELLKTYMA